MQAVHEALSALSNPGPDPNRAREADRFLIAWQSHPESWDGSFQLLKNTVCPFLLDEGNIFDQILSHLYIL